MLDRIKEWLQGYPGHEILQEFSVDWTDAVPGNGGLFPSGMVEASRTEDVNGGTYVENQYNFGIYYIFEKSPGDDIGAQINADWVMDFQMWVQEQSLTGDVPQFGDKTTAIKAENGVLYGADDGGTATYMVQLSVNFDKFYKRGDNNG